MRNKAQIGLIIEAKSDDHTRHILEDAYRKKLPAKSSTPRPEKIAERRSLLAVKGLLSSLEKGKRILVRLPGGEEGVAYGLTPEYFVLVEDKKDPYSPKAVTRGDRV